MVHRQAALHQVALGRLHTRSRQQKSLPIIGSESLFTKLWKEHEEIVTYRTTGHAKCKDCAKHDAELDSLGNRTDAVAQERRQALAAQNVMYTAEHMGERRYAEDAWFRGETYPSRIICIRIDAPIQHQFDLPRQRRVSRDIVKSLDGAKRWSSKITGAQVTPYNAPVITQCIHIQLSLALVK